MRLTIKTILVIMMWIVFSPLSANTSATVEAEALLEKSITAFMEGEDRSVRDRLLQAAYDLDPDNPAVNWQILWWQSWALRSNGSLSSRAPSLAIIAPVIDKIKKMAVKRGKESFSHYIQARYLGAYNQFDQAILEIDKALEIEPLSSRLMYIKVSILDRKGHWDLKQGDDWIMQSRQLLEQILTDDVNPSVLVNKSRIYYKLAHINSHMIEPDLNESIEFYLLSLKNDRPNSPDYNTWNMLSIAYRKNGMCQKAFDAAKKSIEIKVFDAKKKVLKYSGYGRGETSLRYAKYCLEMQKMGILQEATALK
ncbi:MAG: hypothetical protein HRT92_08975 [Piscirickettsiaceae bacterium]|nr:hypothetical protein [Piscirickettsiaceae bacterium]